MSERNVSEEETLPANIALAARCGSRREALDQGLVILAMNLPYWHVRDGAGHELYVEVDQLGSVQEELEAFQEEQEEWLNGVREAVEVREQPASFYVPYAAALLLIGSFILQNAHAPGYAERGRMDAVALWTKGEWWRPLTALFLHGSVSHLLGNLVFGIWYGVLVNRGLGTALGWGLILLSGVLGNTLTAAWHHPEPHLSIGASTAVFGALGILVAEGLAHRWHQRASVKLGSILIPLVAGGVLLGWTGGFDEPQVDGLAHATGFLSGVILGLLACLPAVLKIKAT